MITERWFDCGRIYRGYKVCYHLVSENGKNKLSYYHYKPDNQTVVEDDFADYAEIGVMEFLRVNGWFNHEVKTRPSWTIQGNEITNRCLVIGEL